MNILPILLGYWIIGICVSLNAYDIYRNAEVEREVWWVELLALILISVTYPYFLHTTARNRDNANK